MAHARLVRMGEVIKVQLLFALITGAAANYHYL